MAGELVDRTVEIRYDDGGGEAWHDISADGLNRDPVSISRGVADRGGSAAAGSLNLTLWNGASRVDDSVSARYAQRNPLSDLYGLIGPNLPIRLSAALEGSTPVVRMVGETVALPPRWDVSGRDRWVPVEAAGVLRRLGIPDKPLRSALHRLVVDHDPYAFWPLDDPEGTGAMRSAVGGPRLRFDGTLDQAIRHNPAAGFLGQHLPAVIRTFELSTDQSGGQGRLIASVPGPTEWSVDIATRAAQKTDDTVAWQFNGAEVSVGDLRWNLYLFPAGVASSEELRVILRDTDAGSNLDSDSVGIDASVWEDGPPHHLRLTVTDGSGTNANYEAFLDGVSVLSGAFDVGTSAPTAAERVAAYWEALEGVTPPHAASMDMGYLALFGTSSPTATEAYDALLGHTSEPAGRRVERVCGEQGVSFTSSGDLDATAACGPQHPAEFLAILDAAAKVEAAGSRAPILVEQRTAAGLHFNALNALYLPRAADLELDYDEAHLSPPFDPTPDDFGVVNDATAKRRDGGESRVQVSDGPKGIAAAGRYDKSDTFDAHTDSQLGSIAGWWTAHGVWDEERYPVIRIDVRSLSTRTDGAAKVAAALALDPGSLIKITNLPAEITHDVEQIVLGITETISTEQWLIDLHVTPAGPFAVFELGDPVFGRLDTAGSELAAGVDDDDTSLLVATDSGKTRWTTDGERPSDFPFALTLGGGETVKVTAISGTSSPQTFTVERGVNGITRAWSAGTRLRIARVAVAP